MPEYRITLMVEQDGQPLADMPIIKRLVCNEGTGALALVATPDSNTTSFHPIAAATMPAMNFFLLETDQAVNLQINQQAVATALPVQAGGLVLLIGCNLTQGTPSENIETNNPSSTTNANLTIVAAGT